MSLMLLNFLNFLQLCRDDIQGILNKEGTQILQLHYTDFMLCCRLAFKKDFARIEMSGHNKQTKYIMRRVDGLNFQSEPDLLQRFKQVQTNTSIYRKKEGKGM